jgi:hypothetical protein
MMPTEQQRSRISNYISGYISGGLTMSFGRLSLNLLTCILQCLHLASAMKDGRSVVTELPTKAMNKFLVGILLS